jgi:hypothetical protein
VSSNAVSEKGRDRKERKATLFSMSGLRENSERKGMQLG